MKLSPTPSELLDWYDRSRRDLPWRDPDVTPWQILVSEFMLQQTPVSRVEPIWRDWVARWPTASATAAASAGRRRAGLGQARLSAAGQTPARVRDRHRPRSRRRVPDDVDVLLTLPGVGSYTARAVACFAYQQSVPVVDTNVRRVVARVVHGRADAGSASVVRDHADVSALLPKDATAHIFSAALMELGATVCTARTPRVWPVSAQPVPVAASRFPAVGRSGPSPAGLRRNRSTGAGSTAGRIARQRLTGHP